MSTAGLQEVRVPVFLFRAKNRSDRSGARAYLTSLREGVASGFWPKCGGALLSNLREGQLFAGSFRNFAEGVLSTCGLFTEDVTAAFSKWGSIVYPYAGVHHVLTQAHRYVQRVHCDKDAEHRVRRGGLSGTEASGSSGGSHWQGARLVSEGV